MTRILTSMFVCCALCFVGGVALQAGETTYEGTYTWKKSKKTEMTFSLTCIITEADGAQKAVFTSKYQDNEGAKVKTDTYECVLEEKDGKLLGEFADVANSKFTFVGEIIEGTFSATFFKVSSRSGKESEKGTFEIKAK